MKTRQPGQRGPLTQSAKQKAKAKEVMLALRKKFPDKFNPRKNGAVENFKKRATERRIVREAQKPPETPVAPAPTSQTALQASPPPPAPAPAPAAPLPAAGPKVIEVAETDLFSPASVQAPPPGDAAAPNKPGPDTPPGPGPAQPGPQQAPPPGDAAAPNKPGPDTPKNDPVVNRALAMMVWGMILQMCVMLFGEAMLPQRFKTPAGEIDENENMIVAFCEYFNSLGFVQLSPLWNLLLQLVGYFLIRMNHIINWFKARRAAKTPKPPGEEPLRSAATPPPEEPRSEKTPAPQPPAPPAPQPAPEEEQEQTEPAYT